MRIGDAAAAAGMAPRALRYYEQRGLVTARRTPSGHRAYDEEDIRRLADLDARIARLSHLRARLAARLGEPEAEVTEPARPDGTVHAGADSGPLFRLEAAPAADARAVRA